MNASYISTPYTSDTIIDNPSLYLCEYVSSPNRMIETEHSLNWKIQRKKSQKSFKYLNPPLCLPSNPTIGANSPSTSLSIVNNTASILHHTAGLVKQRITAVLKYQGSYISHLIIDKLAYFLNPSLIIGLIHVILNIFLVFVIIYSVSHIVYFAKIDISYKIKLAREEAIAIMDEASRLYKLNQCDPSTRVPGMEKQCREWKCKMENGLSGLKYTKILVEMLGEALDGFVGRVRLRNVGVIVGFMVIYLIFRRSNK